MPSTIDPRFRPLHVKPNAPHHASQRAAAIQAAYAILLDLYPAQTGPLTTQRNASLAALALTENANSVAAGIKRYLTFCSGTLILQAA
jgi:hypothetical protein